MNYWLVKTDPETYSWNNFIIDKTTVWDGVRNFQARNNLKLMKTNDKVLVYHSQSDKSVMGIAKVSKEFFPDPTADNEKWVAVQLDYIKTLSNSVSLEQIKSEPKLQNIALIKQSRLSVMPLSKEEFDLICQLGK